MMVTLLTPSVLLPGTGSEMTLLNPSTWKVTHSQGKITRCWELQCAGGRRILHGTLEYGRSWCLQVQQNFLLLVNILEFVGCLLSCFRSHILKISKNKIPISVWSFEFPASLRAEIHGINSWKSCLKPMILLASSCLPSCLDKISSF